MKSTQNVLYQIKSSTWQKPEGMYGFWLRTETTKKKYITNLNEHIKEKLEVKVKHLITSKEQLFEAFHFFVSELFFLINAN